MLLRRGLLLLTLGLVACPAEQSPGLNGKAEADPAGSTAKSARPIAEESFRFEAPPVVQDKGPSEAPLSLTASDGTGLKLVAMSAQGVVEGPLAFTELKLRFNNPESRVREGRFRITLPENASISRFAMKIGNRWQEGEVVERQKARRVYEDFLHRRQDPALLEQAAGNEFTARVFPIPAHADKELIISYSHELKGSQEPYRIPLKGLPLVDELDIKVLVAKQSTGKAATSLGGTTLRHETVAVNKSKWVPDLDFEVKLPDQAGFGLRHDNLVVARFTPDLATPPQGVHGLTVLVDTSASRALGFAAQVRLLDQLVEGLKRGAGDKTPLRIVAFDQDSELIFEGKAGDYGQKARSALHNRRALGASDLLQPLRWLADNTKDKIYDRLILITDGVATSGEVEGDGITQAVRNLAGVGFERADALALGGLRDSERLKAITTAGLKHDGVVADGAQPITQIGRRLSRATVSGLKVQVAGARWVWPQQLDGVQPGDEVLIFADLPKGQSFALQLNGQAVALDEGGLTEAPRPLLERAWVRARIQRLLHHRQSLGANDADMQSALKNQVIELSTQHRVLSPFTALLVLETENDYRRYGIARDALANILTVGAQGVQVLADRSQPKLHKPKPRPVRRPRPRMKRAARSNGPRDSDDRGGAAPAPTEAAPAFGDGEAAKSGLAEGLGTRGTGAGGGGSASDGFGRLGSGERERQAAPAADIADEVSAAEESEAPARRFDDASPPPPAPMAEPAPSRPSSAARPARRSRRRPRPRPEGNFAMAEAKKKRSAALTGPLAEVMNLLDADDVQGALTKAWAWRQESPGDVLALVALGEVAEKKGDLSLAARAYGSIIDLFATRADLLRFAASRLERLSSPKALGLAQDTYKKAVAQRPDHPSGHRGLAMAYAKAGEYEAAFEALATGIKQRYPSRFPGVQRILREDLGIIAAAWKAAESKRSSDIEARLKAAGGHMATEATLRFILTWETDSNDVDFHIRDGQGGHAYYSSKTLGSGGTLYADITTGYGPECFTIPGKAKAFPYRLEAHYYRRGPMGYGMGRLQIVHHDGQGGLRFDERPYVVMNDGAYLDLGRVEAKWLNAPRR